MLCLGSSGAGGAQESQVPRSWGYPCAMVACWPPNGWIAKMVKSHNLRTGKSPTLHGYFSTLNYQRVQQTANCMGPLVHILLRHETPRSGLATVEGCCGVWLSQCSPAVVGTLVLPRPIGYYGLHEGIAASYRSSRMDADSKFIAQFLGRLAFFWHGFWEIPKWRPPFSDK